MMKEETTRSATGEQQHRHLSAGAFRSVMDAFLQAQVFHEHDERRGATTQHIREVRDLIEQHVTDAQWRKLLLLAHEAAARGQHEVTLQRFPSAACTDGGYAIDVGDTAWALTLTGASADLYHKWQKELAPRGFGISARILEYPQGKRGDAALILSWKDEPQQPA
jgi:hypothetical protein